MARIDMMFYSDGRGNMALGQSLEQDRKVEAENSGDLAEDERVAAHLTFEEDEESVRGIILGAIVAQHYIECELGPDRPGETVFERLIGEIFKAGMEHGRKSAGKE